MILRTLLIFTILILNCVFEIDSVKTNLVGNKTVSSNVRVEQARAKETEQTTQKPKAKKPAGKRLLPNKGKVSKPADTVTPIKKPGKITASLIEEWTREISEVLLQLESNLVRRDELLRAFSELKVEQRNGTDIVNNMAKNIEKLLLKRADAAEKIMRKAEEFEKQFSEENVEVPESYTYYDSEGLDVIKPRDNGSEWELPLKCREMNKMKVHYQMHFDAEVSLENSSVQTVKEIFPCDERVLGPVYWSENLLPTFKANYADDAMTGLQYLCSAKGFLRHYPASEWKSMYKLKLDAGDEDEEDRLDVEMYDCRLRPWYVSAGGAPRDVVILVDASGSMYNSSNKVTAEKFTMALLSALTDDDQVNVLRFNVTVESPISCFKDLLVPANHINTAAMMALMKGHAFKNNTLIPVALKYAVKLLRKQNKIPGRPQSCQQAIVFVTDSVYGNFTELMMELDPTGEIRLFSIWLHDQFGLRDDTLEYSEGLSCARDGYFAELITHSDVTDQVLRILETMERPLVGQRKERLKVFSDIYAHLEDPRRSEFLWRQKENAEQEHRYQELRRNKEKFLDSANMLKDYMYYQSLDKYGHYCEDEDTKYRYQISVSVPVFEHKTSEDITKKLFEEKQRNATRTYPVMRLLGVAGVDIPLDELRLHLPYHELGGGGTLMLLDHRGNIVLHDNLKPVMDGNILKPGYRTVDFLELEQAMFPHLPRYYPSEWLEFRKTLLINTVQGNKTMNSKNIFEKWMRSLGEEREYFWQRILDHYTAVVVLPKYNRLRAVLPSVFTQELASGAMQALPGTDYTIHPDWLYCRHVEPYFSEREAELLHFIRRKRDFSELAMTNLRYVYTAIPPTVFGRSYFCNEKLMAHVSWEAVATSKWTKEHVDKADEDICDQCELGSMVVFFASENGLTRWQQYVAAAADVLPEGSAWPYGPTESWYKRTVASPDLLVIHAPVTPVRKMRNSFIKPPKLGARDTWLTAARAVSKPGGSVHGVAGYHFSPKHLNVFFQTITNFPCHDENECEPRCDNEDWSCALIDEAGWVVSSSSEESDESSDQQPRLHLANLHPSAMAALLNASIFRLNWIHDYQAVCFPPEIEIVKGAHPLLPTIMKSLWSTCKFVFQVTRELIYLIALLSLNNQAQGDTEHEKWKRRNRVQRDFEREKFERLYDDRVLINRTRVAACDRTRPVYEFQRTPASIEALKREVIECEWPVTGGLVPQTNLILVAIYNPCPNTWRPVPNPLDNEQVTMTPEYSQLPHSASRLACWRNRIPLNGRPPSTKCFRHNYDNEIGYRQCGPWIADDKENGTTMKTALTSLLIYSISLLIIVGRN